METGVTRYASDLLAVPAVRKDGTRTPGRDWIVLYRLLADALVVIHGAFIARRRRRAPRAALAARALGARTGGGVALKCAGSARSRRSRTSCAGEAGRRASGGFVDDYLCR